MAVQANILTSKMQLKLVMGQDELGQDIIGTKTYSNVKNDALDQDVYDVAASLSGLQDHTLDSVHKVQDIVLINV